MKVLAETSIFNARILPDEISNWESNMIEHIPLSHACSNWLWLSVDATLSMGGCVDLVHTVQATSNYEFLSYH